jgi:hypothetical protein
MSDELIMGKYKSQDDLINGYKSLKDSYDTMASNKNKFMIPENYAISESFKLVDKSLIESSSTKAKTLGYTQDQFDKLLVVDIERNRASQESTKKIKEAMGDDKELVEEYITNELGLSKTIIDRMTIEEINTLKTNRIKSLNSQVPAGGNFPTPTSIDINDTFKKMEQAKSSGDRESFKQYLKLFSEQSNNKNR